MASLALGRAASSLGQQLMQAVQLHEQRKRQELHDTMAQESHGWQRAGFEENQEMRPLRRAGALAQATRSGINQAPGGTPLGDTGYNLDPFGPGTDFDIGEQTRARALAKILPGFAQGQGMTPEQAQPHLEAQLMGVDTSYRPRTRDQAFTDRRQELEMGDEFSQLREGRDQSFTTQRDATQHQNAVELRETDIRVRDSIENEEAQADADAAQAIQRFGSIEAAIEQASLAPGRRGELLRRRLHEMMGRKGERDFLGIGTADQDPFQILQNLRNSMQQQPQR